MTNERIKRVRHTVGLSIVALALIFMVVWCYVTVENNRIKVPAYGWESLSILVEAGLEARLVVDDAGIIRLVSPTVAGICGYAPEELLGKPASILVPPNMLGPHLAGFANHLADKTIGQVKRIACDLQKKDGSLVYVEIILRIMTIDYKRYAVVTITLQEKIINIEKSS